MYVSGLGFFLPLSFTSSVETELGGGIASAGDTGEAGRARLPSLMVRGVAGFVGGSDSEVCSKVVPERFLLGLRAVEVEAELSKSFRRFFRLGRLVLDDLGCDGGGEVVEASEVAGVSIGVCVDALLRILKESPVVVILRGRAFDLTGGIGEKTPFEILVLGPQSNCPVAFLPPLSFPSMPLPKSSSPAIPVSEMFVESSGSTNTGSRIEARASFTKR